MGLVAIHTRRKALATRKVVHLANDLQRALAAQLRSRSTKAKARSPGSRGAMPNDFSTKSGATNVSKERTIDVRRSESSDLAAHLRAKPSFRPMVSS